VKPVEPILVAECLRPLRTLLLDLLRPLSAEQWERPTACAGWTVRDVAAHLLDGGLRRLSSQRDGARLVGPETPLSGPGDLVAFLNQLNAEWVTAARRLSPQLLIDLLERYGGQEDDFLAGLDPFGEAFFPVAWAGEERSAAWFDVAREYTEKWHHQQQIRDAVDAPPLTARRWLHPVLDTFLRGLPHAFRHVDAEDGTEVGVVLRGDAGGSWTLRRQAPRWVLWVGEAGSPAARVGMDADTAWRLFTKGLSPREARQRAELSGASALGGRVFDLVAVMA